MLVGCGFEPRPNSRALGSAGSVMTIGFINKRMTAPRGGRDGGVLRISSERDDRIGAKVKTQKNP